MQRLVGPLRRVRERPPSGSASVSCAAAASELQEKGRGGLHSAAASGDLARLQRRWWWKRLRINRRDANKQTPLHLACVNGHADVVRFLAEKNCQLNPRDNFKKSPLMKAVEHQHKDCAAILLKHGANPDLKGSNGNTALHLAALIPSKSLVELLLEHNADIEAKNELGYTPLAVVIMEHCEEMVEFLLQKGANVHAQDNQNRTILMLAATMGNMNLIQLLLRHGADISQEDSMGLTAVHHASLNRCADIDKELQEYVACGRTEECCAEDPAVLASSSSGTATNSPLGTPAPTEAVRILHRGGGVLPAAGAEQEDDFDSSCENEELSPPEESVGPTEVLDDVLLPAADGHGVCAQPLAEERANGVLPTAAGAEQEEDFDSPFDSEESVGPREVLDDVLLPAADGHGVCAQPLAEERANGVLPTASGAEQEEDFDSPFDSEESVGPREVLDDVLLPAADGHGVCAQPLAEERANGVLPTAAGAEQEEDFDSPFDSEESVGPREVLDDVLLPAADGHGVCAQPLAEERANGVLPTAAGAEQEEDFDSPFDSEESVGPREVLDDVLLPAADGHGVCAQPLAEERANGVLPTASGAEQEEDFDSTFDSEESVGPTEVLDDVLLPAADGHGVCAQPLAEEHANGVLPTAAGAEQEEDFDSPFDSEESVGPREVLDDVLLPAADGHGVCAQPLAEERANGVLPTASGAEQEEDFDSPFDSEESVGPREVLDDVLLPAADGHGVCAQPLAEERANGVLPTASGAEQEEDFDSTFDSEESVGPREVLDDVLLPAADGHGVCAQPLAEERANGVLPTASGAEQEEDFDSTFDSEESVGPTEVLDDVLLPAADGHGVCAQPLAEEHANGVLPTAAGAEQEEDFDSFSENEVSALEREELLLKKDASTQADSQADRQRRVRQLVQELADALKKKSLAEASLEAKKRYSRDLQEEKLQLQKELDKSKAKLQELKERHSRTERYAESLKNAIKNKERELTTSRNLWGLLVASSGTAAIPELEERMQWLQVGKARLEARAQQQAKTIEALQKDLQTSISARNALEDLITGFQTTWTAKEHQHRQHGSESKEVKKLAEMKCQSEALLDEMRRKNIALKEEHTRLKMLLEGFQTKLMAYAGRKRESQLSFRGEMKNSCSKVANKVGKEESHS